MQSGAQLTGDKMFRYFRFLGVGAVNTLFGYGVFALSIYWGASNAMAVGLSTAIGVMFNFCTTGHMVFDVKDIRCFPRFLLVYGATCLVNVAWLGLAGLLGLSAYVAGGVALLPMAALTYWLLKKLVYRNDKETN